MMNIMIILLKNSLLNVFTLIYFLICIICAISAISAISAMIPIPNSKLFHYCTRQKNFIKYILERDLNMKI
jgi:hypothetical protein